MLTLEDIRARLDPDAIAYFGVNCCWWTTDPRDLGEIPGGDLPCCPYCASPLMMAPAKDFIASAEADSGHYGLDGLATFVRSYSIPCQHVRKWKHYAMMDASGSFGGMSEIRYPRQPRVLSTAKDIRCTRCGSEFSEADTEGCSGCPKCSSTELPMTISDDVNVHINWHELRILGIWADNWAGICDHNDPTCDAKGAVTGILQRLQAQFPERPPLTILGELQQLQEAHPDLEATGFYGETLIKPDKPS